MVPPGPRRRRPTAGTHGPDRALGELQRTLPGRNSSSANLSPSGAGSTCSSGRSPSRADPREWDLQAWPGGGARAVGNSTSGGRRPATRRRRFSTSRASEDLAIHVPDAEPRNAGGSARSDAPEAGSGSPDPTLRTTPDPSPTHRSDRVGRSTKSRSHVGPHMTPRIAIPGPSETAIAPPKVTSTGSPIEAKQAPRDRGVAASPEARPLEDGASRGARAAASPRAEGADPRQLQRMSTRKTRSPLRFALPKRAR